MNFRSLARLNRVIVENLHQIPDDVDVIVGIPRSGVLAASLVALNLNLPMADLGGMSELRMMTVGRTRRYRPQVASISEARRILILDDSIASGKTMESARQSVRAAGLYDRALFGAIFSTNMSRDLVDIHFETCETPRMFEWNYMHHPRLGGTCMDIDGVICRDPTEEENDGGSRYREFMLSAEPLVIPSAPVGYLVTERLEKYRPETEEWLRRHNVAYKNLLMLDLPTDKASISSGSHAEFKARVYVRSGARIFIESDPQQAQRIMQIARKPVLCPATHTLYRPGVFGDAYTKTAKLSRKLHQMGPVEFSKAVVRRLRRQR